MKNKEKNFVSAVIYVHNAEDRIEKFLTNIISCFNENFEHSEIICVNDYSSDNSHDLIKKLAKDTSGTNISIINLSYFHGLEVAMNAGTDMSIGDYVFEFDNTIPDFTAETIMKIYNHSLSGFDIVSASPDHKQKFSSSFFYKMFDRFTPQTYKLTTESFRILSRRVINRISSMNKTVAYRKALYALSGLKTDKIQYSSEIDPEKYMDPSEKKYRMRLATNCLILFTDVGYRFSISMTLIMMVVSIIMVLYTLITYFTINPVEGWTTTILFLSFSFFGLFGILTVIIKYLQILVELIYKRKQYSFESIEKLN